MNLDAVKALLTPMSDELFEVLLRRQLGGQLAESSVTLEEVGLDRLAREAVAERGSKSQYAPKQT